MIWLTVFYLAIVVTLAIYFYAAGGFASRWWRFGSVGVLGLVVILGIAAFALLLSRPKPLYLEYSSFETVEILGSVLVPDSGIYLWLRFEGIARPYYYVLSWNEGKAENLRTLLRKQRPGQKLMFKRPSEQYWSKNTFYLIDAPVFLPKTGGEPEVLYYNPEQQP